MAEYTKQDIFNIITEYFELYGSAVGSNSVRELTQAELTDATLRALTIPSVLPNTEEWVCTSLRNMLNPIDSAVSDLVTLKQQTAAARDAANAAAEDVGEAVDQAETVNASLVGYTVTITDRDGVSHSVDIGFEIYRTYTSVSAMNADASNVPQGKFVVIATTSTTDPDNAKMYCKNSQGAFTFLCDLDQASSAAWAEWLNSMEPAIRSATSAANQAAGRVDTVVATANSDHERAIQDHNTANSDHLQAQRDHRDVLDAIDDSETETSIASEYNQNPPYIGNDNYWYLYNINTHSYVRNAYAKGDDLDYSTMTQEEIQMLIEDIKENLIVASIATCESIIDELT